MIHLSKRLLAVASMVTPGKCPVDVGCDHGYVPIYLVQKGIAASVLAMDVNEGPLMRARANIEAENLTGQIRTRLSDGLKNYKAGEADCLIIAGMGGMLMCDILKYGYEQHLLEDFSEVVLSPHSDIGRVRRYLHTLGFKIREENMVIDAGKYYTVIHGIKGSEHYDCEEDYLYGKYLIDSRHPVLKNYIDDVLLAKEELYKKVSGLFTPGAARFAPQLEAEIKRLQNVRLRLLTGE